MKCPSRPRCTAIPKEAVALGLVFLSYLGLGAARTPISSNNLLNRATSCSMSSLTEAIGNLVVALAQHINTVCGKAVEQGQFAKIKCQFVQPVIMFLFDAAVAMANSNISREYGIRLVHADRVPCACTQPCDCQPPVVTNEFYVTGATFSIYKCN